MAKEWPGDTLLSYASTLDSEDAENYLYPSSLVSSLSPVQQRHRRNRLIIIFLVLLLVPTLIAAVFIRHHNEAIIEEYEQVWSEYEHVLNDRNAAVTDAQALSEDCYSEMEEGASCTDLDAAIRSAQTFTPLERTTANKAAINKLKKETSDIQQALTKLASAVETTESRMSTTIATTLRQTIYDATDRLEQARRAYNEAAGTIEDDKDREPLKELISRVESMCDKGKALLTPEGNALAPDTKPNQARDVIRMLNKYMDSLDDEEEALRQAQDNYRNKQRAEEEERRRTEASHSPSPSSTNLSPSPSPSTTHPETQQPNTPPAP